MVGFEQTEYTLEEASPGIEVCVVHKECLQREVTVGVYEQAIGIGKK